MRRVYQGTLLAASGPATGAQHRRAQHSDVHDRQHHQPARRATRRRTRRRLGTAASGRRRWG